MGIRGRDLANVDAKDSLRVGLGDTRVPMLWLYLLWKKEFRTREVQQLLLGPCPFCEAAAAQLDLETVATFDQNSRVPALA